MTAVFEFAGKKYKVEITPMSAYKELPDKFGISLLKMFSDEEANEKTLQMLLMDESKVLELMYHFLEKGNTTMSFEEMLSSMEDLSILDKFRDAFWAAIVNFSPPLKKNLLTEIWATMKKEIMSAKLQNPSIDA